MDFRSKYCLSILARCGRALSSIRMKSSPKAPAWGLTLTSKSLSWYRWAVMDPCYRTRRLPRLSILISPQTITVHQYTVAITAMLVFWVMQGSLYTYLSPGLRHRLVEHFLQSHHTFTSISGSFEVRDYFWLKNQPDHLFLHNLRQCFPVLPLRTKYAIVYHTYLYLQILLCASFEKKIVCVF
jgi:hypothetical protein